MPYLNMIAGTATTKVAAAKVAAIRGTTERRGKNHIGILMVVLKISNAAAM